MAEQMLPKHLARVRFPSAPPLTQHLIRPAFLISFIGPGTPSAAAWLATVRAAATRGAMQLPALAPDPTALF